MSPSSTSWLVVFVCEREHFFFRSCCCSCVLCEEGNLRKVKRGDCVISWCVYDVCEEIERGGWVLSLTWRR